MTNTLTFLWNINHPDIIDAQDVFSEVDEILIKTDDSIRDEEIEFVAFVSDVLTRVKTDL